MEKLRLQLKHLNMIDLLYCATGGLIGSLIGASLGNASFSQVGLFTLIGMIFSAYFISKKRMNQKDNE